MPVIRRIIIGSGMFIIAGLSLLTVFRTTENISKRWLDTNDIDQVSRFEARFAGIRRSVGAEKTAGYVTELSPEGVMANPGAQAEYFLTQYTLAPVIIANDPSACRYVIGNFHREPPPPRSLPGGDLAVVADAGTGVLAYKRNGTRP